MRPGDIRPGDGQVLSDNGRVLSDNGRVLLDNGQVLPDNGQVLSDNGQVLSDNGIWLIGRGEGGAGRYSVFFARPLHPQNPVIFLLNRRIPIYKDVMAKYFSLSLMFEQTMRE